MAELKIGDVVQLKSGGPKMTVESTKPGPQGILCTWFDGAERKSSSFQPEALAPAPTTARKPAAGRPRRKLSLDELD